MNNQLLTTEDSKRVADALIEKINDADFNVAAAVRSVIMPKTEMKWREDWLPLTLEDMCDKISTGVVNAVYSSAEKKRK